MTPEEHQQQKKAARKFVDWWQATEGSEEKQSRAFWTDMYSNVLGVPTPERGVLDFERRVQGRRIDVFHEDVGVLIEQKSRGVNLDTPERHGRDKNGAERYETPYEQAKWYADNLPRSQSPRWLIVSNFDEIRIHDLNKLNPATDYETLRLEELPDQLHRLSFLTRKENSRQEREKQLSVAVGDPIRRLYDELAKGFEHLPANQHELRCLNILLTRIVFLLYAEDADLLPEHGAFTNYLSDCKAWQIRDALLRLFDVLKTPDDEHRRDLGPLAHFFYINGGLFEETITIPQFSEAARDILMEAARFDWKDISPTIFGAVFESTLNPDTRRAGGMHYTSIENIHKVIRPLFLDALEEELNEIAGKRNKSAKTRFEWSAGLAAFRQKLASLRILDPACGSGNFLTETYLCLRKLENRVLQIIHGEQLAIGEFDPIQVSIHQFYGVEINDFAVEVAKTALWIAELQMLEQTKQILSSAPFKPFPLKNNTNIHCANALRLDWNDVLPASQCNYIIGNPPFVGYSYLNDEQKEDRLTICGKGSGFLDYVACWYMKAADYITQHPVRCALVSTNSICQGLQVDMLWKPLFNSGIGIDFAWHTFVWNSEAVDQAHVHCVIVGFSRLNRKKTIYTARGTAHEASNINGYLLDAPSQFIAKRSMPICKVPPMAQGHKPAEHGNLLLSAAEKASLVTQEPEAEKWIRPFSMGAEFINGEDRYCLWLHGISDAELDSLPLVKERVEACRKWREAQIKTGDAYRYRTTPHLFKVCNYFHDMSYIGVPSVSSGRRSYVPLGFVINGMIPGNQLYFIESGDIYMFGVLQSQFHNAWIRVVAGRLKNDYRYSNTIVYNNFIWPQANDAQKQHIEQCAQAVLDARAAHPGATLAQLYDPDKMPANLRDAHHALDAAVEAAYGVQFDGDEERITAHLFQLYAQATASKGK